MSQSLNVSTAVIFSCICWIIFVPTLGPVFVLLWIYRKILCLTLSVFRPQLEMLNSADAGLTDNVRKNTLYNIGVLFILENESNKSIDIDYLRRDFADKFLCSKEQRAGGIVDKSGYRKLTKLYTSYGGYYFWEEAKDFVIENHIVEYSISDVKELDNFISEWIRSPYKKDSPMWGMALITWNNGGGDTDGSSKNCFAVAFRIHHAMADGISVLQMCNRMAGLDTSINQKSKSIRTVHTAARVFILPYLLKNLLGKLTAAPNPFANIAATDDCCIVFTSVKLDEIKKVRQMLNVPFATILMTVVGSVLRRLLQDCKIELPEFVNLGNALPWPSRPSNSLCNEWTFGVFKVPIAEENLQNRLRDTAQDFWDYLYEGSHLVLKPFMFGLMSLVPFGFLDWMVPVKETVSIGPCPIMSGSLVGNLNDSYQLWGCNVKHVYPVACNAEPHLALGSISVSHGNQMDVSILLEKSLFASVPGVQENLKKYFEAEFKKLLLLSDLPGLH